MTSDDDELRATIARVRALLDKASLGPWELAGDSPAHIVVLDEKDGSIAGHIADAGRDDAELIAALRNAAPALLNAAERAQDAQEAQDAVLRRACDRIVMARIAEPAALRPGLRRARDIIHSMRLNDPVGIRALKETTDDQG